MKNPNKERVCSEEEGNEHTSPGILHRYTDASGKAIETKGIERRDQVSEQNLGVKNLLGVRKKSKKLNASNKRRKQLGAQECLLCGKHEMSMRDHLRCVHKLEEIVRRFLLSFYRTRNVKAPVYQCNQCIVRYTNPWRDHKGHDAIRIRDVQLTSSFPPAVIGLLHKNPVGSRKATEVIDTYDEYIKEGINKTIRRLFTEMMAATNNFQNARNLRNFIYEWKAKNNYKSATILKHLSKIVKFVRYTTLYFPTMMSGKEMQWEAVNADVREEYTKSAARQQSLTSMVLFEKVPTLKETQEMRNKVIVLLNQDMINDSLSYRESLAFNFFLLQSSLNIRSGPLLSITVDDFKNMKPDTVYPQTNHKTGYVYPIAIMYRSENMPWLQQMLKKYKLENKKDAVYVFSNTMNRPCTTICKMINEVFHSKLGGSGKSFGSNSIRKMWEKYKTKNEGRMGNHGKAHTNQSGHSERTAQKFYIAPPSAEEFKNLLNVYDDVLVGRGGSSKKSELRPIKAPRGGKKCQRKGRNNVEEMPRNDRERSNDEPESNEDKIIHLGSKKKLRTSRELKDMDYYESDQLSGDSLDDEEYDIAKDRTCTETKQNITTLLLHDNRCEQRHLASTKWMDGTSEVSMDTKGKREMFVMSLKTVKERFFSDVDKIVLEAFHDVEVRPTKAMVLQQFTKFMKQNEIDPVALQRVQRKVEKAWYQYMAN